MFGVLIESNLMKWNICVEKIDNILLIFWLFVFVEIVF